MHFSVQDVSIEFILGFKNVMIISISFVGGVDVLDNFEISFLYPHVSRMFVGFIFVHFKWGCTVSPRLGCYAFYNDLKDTGMIIPLRSIFCIIWPSWSFFVMITFIHVICIS